MDKTTERLVAYTASSTESALSEHARHKTSELLFDAISCAIVGSGAEPPRIAARVARRTKSEPGATVLGFGFKTSPELAALANTMMVRAYDFNDTYGGHPSDMTPGVLSAGEVVHASGPEVLDAIALAYEVYGSLIHNNPHFSDFGLDQGTFMQVGVALAAGKLWGLSEDQLANAASLALVPNLPLGASRWGYLTMMKGAATSFAVRNGIFAAMLAQEGLTSAPEPFEGIRGLQHLTGPFELQLPVEPGGRRVVEMTTIKPIPAENNTIGALELMIKNRDWAPVSEIESIDIDVAGHLDVHLADETKYDPRTRESADHSLPYLLAVALVDGKIDFDSYAPARIADPSLRPLMRKIRVHGSRELNDLRRASPPPGVLTARIRVRTTSGREFNREVTYHSGHPAGEINSDVLNAKFDLCSRELQGELRERLRSAWWNVADTSDICEPIGATVGYRSL